MISSLPSLPTESVNYAKRMAEEITSNQTIEKIEEWLKEANSTQINSVLVWIRHTKPAEVDAVIILMSQTIKKIRSV